MKYSLSFLFGYPFDFLHAMCFRLMVPCFKKIRKNGTEPWIIGGHRGRIYEDNSAAVHAYITKETKQEIIWISANKKLTRKLEEKGYKVLRKNSWKARLAILKAPVFIYSHGEDDIDQFFRYFRKCSGLRIHLHHGEAFTKTGYFAVPGAETWSKQVRKQKQKKIVDFDYMLTGSDYEKEMLAKSFPFRSPDDFIPNCGCAHVDKFIRAKETPPQKRILWMPTFRDDSEDAQKLKQMELDILHNKKLHQYLENTGTTFTLIHHINSNGEMLNGIHPNIEIRNIQEIGSIMPTAECFISDYSGLIVDWLIFERPFIRFAFDIEHYSRKRSFYIPLKDFLLGKDVFTVDEFIEHVTSNDWKNTEPFKKANDFYRNKIFPNMTPTHAEICYKKIVELQGK